MAFRLCDKKIVEENNYSFTPKKEQGDSRNNGCYILSVNSMLWNANNRKESLASDVCSICVDFIRSEVSLSSDVPCGSVDFIIPEDSIVSDVCSISVDFIRSVAFRTSDDNQKTQRC